LGIDAHLQLAYSGVRAECVLNYNWPRLARKVARRTALRRRDQHRSFNLPTSGLRV